MIDFLVSSRSRGEGSLDEGSAEYSVRERLLYCVLLGDTGVVGSEVYVPFDTPFPAMITEHALTMSDVSRTDLIGGC